jgi:hypothetical protein
MSKDLGALISLNLGFTIPMYPRDCSKRWKNLPVYRETVQDAAFTLPNLKRGKSQ